MASGKPGAPNQMCDLVVYTAKAGKAAGFRRHMAHGPAQQIGARSLAPPSLAHRPRARAVAPRCVPTWLGCLSPCLKCAARRRPESAAHGGARLPVVRLGPLPPDGRRRHGCVCWGSPQVRGSARTYAGWASLVLEIAISSEVTHRF
jgi:hypothetical protein